MKFRGVALAALTIALVFVAAAGAKTIRGTAKADTIRGTAGADTIYGLRGNDRLFGMGGNDRLIGGPGTDRISCGAGRDRVNADRLDRVAGDCEVVTRPSRIPNPPPPPTPPAPPPPPTGPNVAPGHYVSNTPQGRYVHFDVDADGRTIRNLRAEFNLDCRPSGRIEGGYFTVSSTIAISANRTFTVAAVTGDQSARLDLQGQFDALNNVSGTLRGQIVATQDGVRYECDSGAVPYSGRRQ